VSHFKIQPSPEPTSESENISVLNVAPISAQMHGDAVRTRSLAGLSCGQDVGLAVVRFHQSRIPRLPQCGDVVDIDAKLKHHALDKSTRIGSIKTLMFEMAHPCKNHGHSALIRSSDHLGIAHGPARLDSTGRTGFRCSD
jgi:hypothetical protein